MALCPKCGSPKVERYTDHGLSCTACGHDGATVEFTPDLRSDETKAVDDRVARARADERERCALIAEAHKGAAARKRLARGFKLHMAVDGYEEIVAEERGEDIAAEIIAREIRAPH